MSWHKITHINSGEVQYVASLAGIDLDNWEALEIVDDRCPDSHEQIDQDGYIFVPLDWEKSEMLRMVSELKAAKQNGVIPTPMGKVDGDDSSKVKMNGLVNMALIATQAQQPFAVQWTMADNSNLTLDNTTAVQLGLAVGQFVGDVHAYAISLKARINAATSHDELDLIDIHSGWPGEGV